MKKSKLISGKGFAGVRGIPLIVVLVALVSVIMTVGLAFVSAGYLLRAIQRKSRKEEEPLDWYTLPGRLDSTANRTHPRLRPRRSLDLEATFHRGRQDRGQIRIFPANSASSPGSASGAA